MQSDPIIEAAKRDLATLEAQRQEVEDFIRRYEHYKATLHGARPSTEIAPAKASRSSPVNTVMSAVHDILMKRNDALSLTEILALLTERGVIVGGKNPKQNLSQKLSAAPQLKSYGKHGWYFADSNPPCLQPKERAKRLDDEYEEDPDAFATRPSYSNGAAVGAA